MKKIIYCLFFCMILNGCSKGVTVKGVHPARTRVESTVSTVSSGTVDAEQQAVLGFSASGRVTRVSTHLGDRVKRGQILAEIENQDAKSTLANAELELKRSKELLREGLISQVGFDDARRSYDVAKSALEKTIIAAPFDGIITQLDLSVGELSQSLSSSATTNAATQMRIVDEKPRIVKGNIDEVDLSKIKIGSEARVKILAVRVEPFLARVFRVVPFVSTTKENDRTSQIELKIMDAVPGIPVGASADVEVIVDSRDAVLAAPSRAVLGHGTSRYAYRVQDGRAHKVEFTAGLSNYDRSEIMNGLTVEDVLIYPPEDTELKDGLKVKVEIKPWP